MGGCIVDSGSFDWAAHADKFPGLCAPDDSYHGLAYAEAFGKMAYLTKATAQLMRDLGSIQSPQNAFLLNLGLETLHLRMKRHCENAQQVAEFLKNHPQVAWLNLKMICIVTHVADARTCVLHPASHTHRQLSEEQLREAGIAPDLIRLSVGIEDVEDIIEDIQQAMESIS